MTAPMFTVSLHDTPVGSPTVVLAGEFDLAAVRDLRACFEEALASSPADVHVDLAAVEFIDSSALGVLASVFGQLRERNGRLVVTAASPFAIRILEISGLAPYLLADPVPEGTLSRD